MTLDIDIENYCKLLELNPDEVVQAIEALTSISEAMVDNYTACKNTHEGNK